MVIDQSLFPEKEISAWLPELEIHISKVIIESLKVLDWVKSIKVEDEKCYQWPKGWDQKWSDRVK